MTERDAFELRFAAAVRDHVGHVRSDLDPVGLAHRIALRAPRHRGFAAALAWRDAVVPPRIWVPLLLAALLAALVGGMLIAGSPPASWLHGLASPSPRVAPAATDTSSTGPMTACPIGSTPDEPGPADQARPAVDEPAAIAFDRRSGKVVAVVNPGGGVETWTFDVCTNTWTQRHPGQAPPRFDWAALVYDIDSDTTILFSYQEVWAYDLQADSWTEMRSAPTDNPVFAAYDPVSGLVVATDDSDRQLVWSYDVEADTWSPIHLTNAGPPDASVIAYDVSVNRLVAYGVGTWLLDIRTGTWSKSRATMPSVVGWLVAPGLVYDEASKQTLVFRRDPLTVYDATADRWEILDGGETPVGPKTMVYDPLNRRLVGWGDQTWGPIGAVAALNLATGRWTVLLEPSGEFQG